MIVEVFTPGMTAMAAPVRRHDGNAIGVVTIAGPLFRLTEERMLALAPRLIAAAAAIAETSSASPLFRTHAA
jgi:DNA-binding IclR family transcriptional regulator